MKKFFYLALVLSLLCIPTESGANEPRITKKILDNNGLTVVVHEIPNNPMVSVYMLVKTGSATEGKYLGAGLSHFLEHMLFKGTEKRGIGEIPATIQAVGGSLNASTSLDFTIYTINVPYKEFDVGLDVVADMIMNSTLDPVEVEKEREVVYNEMRLHNDRPGRYLTQLAYKTIFKKHPYRHPIIGYKDLLARVSRDEMMDYYKSTYIPNNMVLAVAGNVKAEEVMPKIEEVFKDFERKPYLARVLPQEEDQISSRRVEDVFVTDLTRVSIAYPTVSMLDNDLYALDVLAQILGHGKSSRLHVDLYKKKKIVQYVGVSNYTPVDKGAFDIEAVIPDEENVEIFIESALEHVESIKKKGVTVEELEKAKKQVLSDYVFGNQTTQRVAWFLAYDEAFAGDYKFSSNYVKGVEKVKLEDIKRVAKEYLVENAQNIIVLRPKKEDDGAEEMHASFTEDAIQKEVLPNGLTILTRADSLFDIVTIRLNMRGGLYEEVGDLYGTSSLMSSSWTKGTKSMTGEEIAEYTESKGMKLSPSGGRNSNGIYLDCLKDDWDDCMDLLKDIVYNPTFPQEEIDLLKDQYKTAIKIRNKNIFKLSSHTLKQNLYKTHPFGREIKGTEESLDKIQREDIVHFYEKLRVPNNMVISVIGNVDREEVLERIKKDYGDLVKEEIDIKSFSEEDLTESKHIDVTLDKEQAILLYGFRAVDFKDPDYHKLDVLMTILGSSFSGRLFTNIRDKEGKAYTLGGSVSASIDTGYVYIYVLTDDKNVDDVDVLVRKEIEIIQNELVSDEELNDVKRYMKGNQKGGLQTYAQQNSKSNLNELYKMGYDYDLKYDSFIDVITKEDVKQMANEYLDLNSVVTVYVRPNPKE